MKNTFHHISEVGFIVHKRHSRNIKDIRSINLRGIYLIVQGSNSKEQLELFYNDVTQALQETPTHYTILTDEFNAKIGEQLDDSETSMGKYGYGEQNER